MLADLVHSAVVRVLGDRGLATTAVPDEVDLVRPRDPGRGDYATTVALRAAGAAGVAPVELAGWLADALVTDVRLAAVEVAGPGFVNLRLTAATRAESVRATTGVRSTVNSTPPATVHGQAVSELAELVGVDAARYAAFRESAVDIEILGRRTDDNPVHCVQYAHSRLDSLLRNAEALGIELSTVDLELLDHPREVELARTVAEFPAIVDAAPHRLTRYLESLADQARGLTEHRRVLPLGDEEPGREHSGRLALCAAARHVLATGLGRLGITAPQRL